MSEAGSGERSGARPLPVISVVIPVRDAAGTLADCIAALKSQDPGDGSVELLFVDNGSTDGSLGILRSAPGIRLLEESRPGAYAARNTGVGEARGRIIAFTDPDCIADEGWIRSVIETFADPSCSLLLGQRRPFPDEGFNRLLGDYEITKDRWVIASRQPLKYYGFTNTMAIRREAWEAYGPFVDRPRGSDTIFVRRLVDAAGCAAVRYVPGMRVSHREIDGPFTYLRKAFTYGRSLQSYGRIVPVKPLSFRDRIAICAMTARDHRYGLPRILALTALLAGGMVAWSIGRLAGRWRR